MRVLSLERGLPQNYDVLAVDAFSGDAIPVHLLTIEAFREYFRHVKSTGVVAVHVSNSYLDLATVVSRAAEALHKPAIQIIDEADEPQGVFKSVWALLGNDPDVFRRTEWTVAGRKNLPPAADVRLWTDDHVNLIGSLTHP